MGLLGKHADHRDHICDSKKSENPESRLLIVDQYAFVSILFIFGIILGTVTRPDEQTVTFVAFLLTVPLLFTDKPIRMISCIFFFVIAFSITAIFVKEDYVLVADIIDVTVFGTISAIISTYMMSVKCQRFLYRAENESLEQSKKASQEKISKYR